MLCVTAMTRAEGAEHRVRRANLPAAVARTVDRESAAATVRGLSKETDNGETYYEAELGVNGHSKDVLIDSEGLVVEVEEEVAFDSLPDAVQRGLLAHAGGGKIVSVESLTRNGKLLAYEAHLRTGLRTSEVQVGVDGRPLDSAE